MKNENEPDFDGATYDPALDHTRLTGQLKKIKELMQPGGWWTYEDIQRHFPTMSTNSISARIRDLRKDKFGAYDIYGERIGGKGGVWRFQFRGKKHPNAPEQLKLTAAAV